MSNRNESRREFLKKSTLMLASAGVLKGSSNSSFTSEKLRRKIKTEKPHVILIMTDQHRGDCLGCVGNKIIKTPNIDSIGNDGVIFTNGYTSVPSCTPARAGLLTGYSPWKHGMLGYGRVAVKYKNELPQLLRDSGYFTFGIGKMHWWPQKIKHGFHGVLVDESGRREFPGFISDYHDWFNLKAPGKDPEKTGIGWNEHRAGEYAHAKELHPTFWTGQTAVELINNYEQEMPLFLKISFARPHSPYDAPKCYQDLYKEEDMPKPFLGKWSDEFAGYKKTKSAAFGDFGIKHAKKARKAYYANITFIDDQIGDIINVLKIRGMYDNSIIIFTADHGDMLGDHHHWRKTYAYEGSSKIPFVMKVPGDMQIVVNKGIKMEHPVELRDVLPTFLDAAGSKIPEDVDGRSLLSLVGNKNAKWREYIDMEHATCYRNENYWCALTDGKIKYIYFFSNGKEQLFDLVIDSKELTDVSNISSYSDILKIWRQRMVEHLTERGEDWVKNGKLQIRESALLYSPNYPNMKPPKCEFINYPEI